MLTTENILTGVIGLCGYCVGHFFDIQLDVHEKLVSFLESAISAALFEAVLEFVIYPCLSVVASIFFRLGLTRVAETIKNIKKKGNGKISNKNN